MLLGLGKPFAIRFCFFSYPRSMRSFFQRSAAFAILPLTAYPNVQAAPLSWDPTGSAGTALGGSGAFTNTATDLFWWNGTANASWTDTLGVDTAVLQVTPIPDPLPDPSIYNTNLLTIPAGTTIVGNGLSYVSNGFTVAGPGGFNFRNNTATATAPATLTVLPGITGTFTAANNQNGGTLPPITITGGGTLRWGAAANGTKIALEGGTFVECIGSNQVLGGGTNNINNGTLRYSASGAADLFYNSAIFAGPVSTGPALGKVDLNGRTEVIGSIVGNFNITNTGISPATVVLSGSGTASYTGIISDHPAEASITTGLTLTGTNIASGANFSSTGNILNLTIGRPQTYTGNTTLQRGGLILDFNHAANPGTSDLLYNGAPAFSPGSATHQLIFASAATTGPEAGTAGRTVLTINGKNGQAITQRFNGLFLQPDAVGGINYTLPAGATAANTTATLRLGAISRSPGSSFNISNLGTTNGLTIETSTGQANQILDDASVPWLMVAGSDWVAKDPTNTFLIPATSLYTPAGTDTLTDHANSQTNSDVRLRADTTIKSYRHNLNERRTVDLDGHTLTTGAILIGSGVSTSGSSITGGNLTSSGSDLLLVHTAGGNYRYYGIGSTLIDHGLGPVGFTKSGTGGTLLTANNTSTGKLVLNQGILILTGSNRPTATLIHGNTTQTNGGQLPVNSNTINLLQLGNSGTTGSLGETSVTGSAPITIGALSALALKRSDNVTVANEILGSGHFIQAGTGTTTFDGPAALYGWRGDTIVSTGVLHLDYTTNDSGKISDASILRLSGGTVRMGGGSHTEILSSLTLNSGHSRLETSGGSTGRFRLNTINGLGTTTAAGTAGSALNLANSGIADTDSTNTNGILGAAARITLAGADWATNATNSGDGLIVPYSGYTPLLTTAGTDTAHSEVTSASVLLTGNRTTHTLRLPSTSGPRTVDLGSGQILTLNGGGLLLSGNQPINFQNGILRSGTAVSPELIIHNHALEPVTFQSKLGFGVSTTGQTHLNLSGPGTSILDADNNYGGVTYISGGTAVVTSNANLGGANGTIGIALSQTNSPTVTLTSAVLPLGFGPGSRLLGQTVSSISGSTVTLAGNAATALPADSTAAWATGGTVALNRGTLKVAGTFTLSESNAGGTGGTMTLNRTITLNGAGGTIDVADGHTLTVSGATNGPGGLTKTGSGTLVYTGGAANTATGPVVVENGTLRAAVSTGFSFYSNHLVGAAGTLDLNGIATTNTNQTIGSLAGSGTVTNNGSAASTLNTGAIFTSTTFSGLIQNGTATTALTKVGTGTLTLSGANTYSGATTVEAGRLIVTNTTGSATGSGPVTIRNAASLGGAGIISGAVSLRGTLAPGDPTATASTDVLTIESDLNCQAGSSLNFEINGPNGANHDRLQVTGSVNLATQQEVVLTFLPGYTPAAGHRFDLIDAATLNAPDVVFDLPTLPHGLVWVMDDFSTTGTVAITSAPGNLYNTWLGTHFTATELANPTLSGPAADADQDGLANALEFAAGSLPRDSASGGASRLPVLSLTNVAGLDYVTLTFTAHTAHLSGIFLTGQSSITTGAWPDSMPMVASTPQGDGTTILVFRSPTATSLPIRRFYRLSSAPVP